MFTGVPAQCEDTALEAEAARFARESGFLHGRGRYVEALEAAETAYALHPESKTCQECLITALIYMSSETLAPGTMNVTPRGNRYSDWRQLPAEQIRRSLEFAKRAAEIQQKYDLYGTGRWNLYRLRGHWEDYHPKETATEIDALNRQMLKQWVEKVYEPTAERFFSEEGNKDKNVRRKYADTLADSLVWVGHQYGSATRDAAVFFETLIGDYARAKLSQEDIWNNGPVLDIFYTDLIAFAAKYRSRPPANSDPAIDATLERIAKILDKNPSRTIQMQAWLVRNKMEFNVVQSLTSQSKVTEVASDYIRRLGEKIKSLPRGIPEEEYSILYNEAGSPEVIVYCFQDQFLRCADILEIANSRNEFVGGRLTSELLGRVAQKDNYRSSSDQNERFAAVVAKQIEIGRKTATDRVAFQLLEISAMSAGIPGVEGSFAKPWKEEIVLFKSDANGHRPVPVLRNDVLYLFVSQCRQAPPPVMSMRLISIDLKTMERKEYPATLEYDEANMHGGWGYYPTFVDDTNAYFGTRRGQGILVFPLDGSEPWSLSQEGGLPGKEIHGLCSMHGKLYAGLRDEQGRSWIIALDVKTRKWDIIVSTAAKEGHPLANIVPGPYFSGFFEDVERNRLLVFVEHIQDFNHGKEKAKLNGIWSIDGTTQEMVQLGDFYWGIKPGHFPHGESRVMLPNSFGYAMLLDMKKAGNKDAVDFLCHNINRKWDSANERYEKTETREWRIHKGTLHCGYLWGEISDDDWKTGGFGIWGRVFADGKSEMELLKKPEAFDDKSGWWAPRAICRATSDGKSLVVGDYFSVVLLRFEK